ncbi:unnamed protein product [Somion occarium]|uniref:Fungal-type protein kinase domain-containing protein n=1 Tax=Somion occarium TaxID=3059160 RepID=A0ABP1CYK9_9APHY
MGFAGAMPLRTFFSDFMPAGGRRWEKEVLPKMPKVKFSRVPFETDCEKDMYGPICSAVNKAKICPGFKLISVANKVSKKGCQLRPDLALVERNGLGTLCDIHCWSEIKGHRRKDAFYMCDPEDPTVDTLEKDEGDSADSRGQLISYATALLSRQHRVFAFSLHFFGRYVRILRWDRSGCVVSEAIDYQQDPDGLAEFFWRYSHLTPEQRGFDTSAVRATKGEEALLSFGLDAFIKESPRDVKYLRPRDDPTYVAYKITMDDGRGGTRKFIIRQPFWDADSPCGRATRGYAAYDLTERRMVFLKDSWREEGDDCEAEIYDELMQCNVPYLPNILRSGDVKIEGEIQRTKSHEYSHPSDYPTWRLPCEAMRNLVHYRLVQELAYPLASARSSRELVQVLHDAVESIKVAYKVGKIFHRDISSGNIMIGKNGRGILNDWDHAMRLLLGGNPHLYRTGTWQFISIRLLQQPTKPHEVHDDLESAFWVLLYNALHYFPHQSPPGRQLRLDLFNEIHQEGGQSYGGEAKSSVLLFGLHGVTWQCKPLNDLIYGLHEMFRQYICSVKGTAGFKTLHQEIEDIDNILNLFDKALSSDGWVEKDAVQDLSPKLRKLEVLRQERKARTEAIVKTVRRTVTIEYGKKCTIPKTAPSANRPHSRSIRKDLLQQRSLAPEAGPSRAVVSSCSSQKRTIDDMSPEEPPVRSKRAKTATNRRPKAQPPAPPLVQHRYPTRSKSNESRRRRNSSKKSAQEDVELRNVEHRYPTRSKSNESHRRNNSVVERNTELARIRRTNKSTCGDPKRSQPKSSTRRRR